MKTFLQMQVAFDKGQQFSYPTFLYCYCTATEVHSPRYDLLQYDIYFVAVPCKQIQANTQPQEGIRMNSHRYESPPVSCKQPPLV